MEVKSNGVHFFEWLSSSLRTHRKFFSIDIQIFSSVEKSNNMLLSGLPLQIKILKN